MGWTSTDKLVLFITIPVATICAGILYYLYFSDDESWDDLGIVTNKTKMIEMKVPCDKISKIVGRSGSKIKEIQGNTNTKIHFKDLDPESAFKICRIKGTPEDVERAENLINEIILTHPNVITEEIWVPQTACGRIIGRCGETIKQISNQSNANITIERYTPGVGRSRERQILIRGTAQEIAVAVSLINAKVAEDADLRSQVNSRSPRHRDRGTASKEKPEVDTQKLPEVEQLIAEASDSMTRVYVSAVASPENFWVQLVLPKSAELDQLGDTMTDYYSNPDNRELHTINDVYKGQIVAALGAVDNRWYRVKVYEEVKKDSSDPELDVYYVDYGESMYVKKSDCCQLRTDFLSLRFQAIECSLHNVKPPSGDTSWSEAAIEKMEDLAYSAQWKPVLVKVVDFDKSSEGDSIIGPNGRPIVTVFDPERGLDVGEELVRLGLAERVLPGDRKESQDVSSEDMSTIGGGDESTASVSSLPGPEDSLMGDVNKPTIGDAQAFLRGESNISSPIPPKSARNVDFAYGERNSSQTVGEGGNKAPQSEKVVPKPPQPAMKPAPQLHSKSEEPQPPVPSKQPDVPNPGVSKREIPVTPTEQFEPKTKAKAPSKIEPESPKPDEKPPKAIPTKPSATSNPDISKSNNKSDPKLEQSETSNVKPPSQPASYDPFMKEPAKSSSPSADDFLSAERSQADPSLPKKGRSPQEILMQKANAQQTFEAKNSKVSNGND